MLVTLTSSIRSRRLEEKRGVQNYKTEDIVIMASKRKVALTNLDPDLLPFSLDVINLLFDDILLLLANTCDMEVGGVGEEQTQVWPS